MKRKRTPTERLRRSAWVGFVGGWLLAVLFVVMATATMHLRATAARHWPPEQVEPFRRDCLAALAPSPQVAERFEGFCSLFNFATSTAEDFMLWFAFFSVLIAVTSAGHAVFAEKVLRHLKQDGIHNRLPVTD